MRTEIDYIKELPNLPGDNLRTFLTWLITPQNEEEQLIFEEAGLIDNYCELINKIPHMTDEELRKRINIEIAHHGFMLKGYNIFKSILI